MTAGRAMYPTLDAYYTADGHRLPSAEADYGAHWRLDGWECHWRVSYLQGTGEIYAVHLGRTIGPVFVLGRVLPDPIEYYDRTSVFYDTLDGILQGWDEHCGRPDGLRWLIDRLSSGEALRASRPPGAVPGPNCGRPGR